MTRDEWLAMRKTGVGASDAAAVANMSPWETPYSVWCEKRGLLPTKEVTAPMRWGLLLEPAIARAYVEETGREIAIDPPEPTFLRHPEHPWMVATPDRMAGDRVVQLKTASPFAADEWGEPGTDEVPGYYLIQVTHEMAVTGLHLADVPVLIGGSDFRVYTVERNEDLVSHLITIEAAFWRLVEEGEPPEPDWRHPRTVDLVKSLYPVDDGQAVALGERESCLVRDYIALGERLAADKETRDSVKAMLLHAMGPAALAVLPDGTTLRRKAVTRKAYEVKESVYIEFRVKPPKGVFS